MKTVHSLINFLIGDLHSNVDINKFKSLFSAMLLAITGGQVVIVQPGYVQGLVEFAGYSDKQAGYITSAEMFGFLFTTLLLIFLAPRLNWRKMFVIFLLTVLVGNLVSIAVHNFGLFTLIRFITGTGSGGLVSLGFTSVGLSLKPERNFGFTIVMALSYGATVLLLMPGIYACAGMPGILLLFAAFAAAGLYFVRYVPVSGRQRAQIAADAISLSWSYKAMGLLAIFFYFIAQGAVWSYLFLIGTAGGVGQQQVATGLTFAQFAGIAGGFTAAFLGVRIGRTVPLTIGIFGGIVPLMFLFGSTGVLVYGIAVSVYNYAWNMVHPYLLGAMATFDRSGHLLVYTVATWKLGLAVGPALAASVINEGNYSNVNWLGTAAFTLCLLLILPPVWAQMRLTRKGSVALNTDEQAAG